MEKSGLYIHIPFCKSRCAYCDFYSTTCGMRYQDAFADALEGEMSLRRGYLPPGELTSVYLGGGTPSVLRPEVLTRIFRLITDHFTLAPDAEVTIEANPDDVTPQYADLLASLPVNRVSMGVQTFDDSLLRLLNRRHNASQADSAVTTLLAAGINNLSIDLIYSLPGQTPAMWQSDLDHALSLPINHLSAYALSYEEGTRLHAMLSRGEVAETDDETSLTMYRMLMDNARQAGMLHYEISNFALLHHEAVHNSGYWHGMRYLGVGPGAHSYDGHSRHANKPDLEAYIRARGNTLSPLLSDHEALTPQMQHEELLLTSLRTAHGLDLAHYTRLFGNEALDGLLHRAMPYLKTGQLAVLDHHPLTFTSPAHTLRHPAGHTTLALTTEGLFVSDGIISDLF